MTAAEQTVADDRMRAEIAKLIAESSKLNAEISKVSAETFKLHAETAKISRERFWIPFTIFAGVFTAVLTILPKLIG